MENMKYLNEERYQKTKKKISFIAIIILIIGLSIGGFLIYNGVAKPKASKASELKIELEKQKKQLEEKGIEPSRNYSDGEAYDLYIITNALDPSFDHCSFDEYKNNTITHEYCSAKNASSEFTSSAFIGFGGFICFATIMIAFSVFMITKQREILAFGAQQIMPVGKEVITDVTPTVGKAAKTITKDIVSGIKEGLKNNDDNE